MNRYSQLAIAVALYSSCVPVVAPQPDLRVEPEPATYQGLRHERGETPRKPTKKERRQMALADRPVRTQYRNDQKRPDRRPNWRKP